MSIMAIHSSPFGPVEVSGDDAKSFSRKIAYGRGTKAAAASAKNGRHIVATFAKTGLATVKLKAAKVSAKNK